MDNKLVSLAALLYESIQTPVSPKILEKLNEKQLNYLWHLNKIIEHARKMEDETHQNLWDDERADAEKEIKSVLDFGKSLLKSRAYRDKTKFYLNNKLK